MGKVLCIGDVMLDVIVFVPEKINYGADTPSRISTRSGGAGGNVAAWIAFCGEESHLLARVGNDVAGKAVLADLDAQGVRHSKAIIEGVRTGVVVILVDPSGERTMLPETAANAGLALTDLPDLDGFSAVYLSGYALLNLESRPGVLAMIDAIAKEKIPIFFDPSTVGSMQSADRELVRSWLPQMATVLMNEEEAFFLSSQLSIEQALDDLLLLTPTVVIKRAGKGAVGKSRGGSSISLDAIAAKVIDTTGAGDSFAGGFIAQWLTNPDLRACLEAGITRASQCVAIVGGRAQVTTTI